MPAYKAKEAQEEGMRKVMGLQVSKNSLIGQKNSNSSNHSIAKPMTN